MHLAKLLASPLFNVTLFSLFWAFQILVTRIAFASGAKIGSYLIQSAITVLIFSSLILLPRTLAEFHRIWTSKRSAFLMIIAANFCHYGLGTMFSTTGIAFTSATNAGFLSKLSFVFTLTLAYLFLGEPMPRSKLLAGIAMLVGAYLLMTEGQAFTPHFGDLLMIGACICWASGNVVTKFILVRTSVSSDLITMIRPFIGFPVLLIFCLLMPEISLSSRQAFGTTLWSGQFTFYAIINGLLTILTWIFLNRTLSLATASYMTMMSMLTPVVIAVIGYTLLNEHLSPIQLVGCLLIIAAGVYTNFAERHRRWRK